jgi:hypothetical protein
MGLTQPCRPRAAPRAPPGGRGAVTFELAVAHGVKCTLVEPRALKLSRAQHRALKERGVAASIERVVPPASAQPEGGQQTRGPLPQLQAQAQAKQQQEQPAIGTKQQQDGAAADGSDEEEAWWRQEGSDEDSDDEGSDAGADAEAAPPSPPPPEAQLPWLAAMRQHAASGGAAAEQQPSQPRQQEEQAREQGQQQRQQQRREQPRHANGSGNGNGAAAAPPQAPVRTVTLRQVQAYFGPELWRSEWWAARGLGGCSVVVGQHPDEATEAIVDYGLEAGKPFAVRGGGARVVWQREDRKGLRRVHWPRGGRASGRRGAVAAAPRRTLDPPPQAPRRARPPGDAVLRVPEALPLAAARAARRRAGPGRGVRRAR